MIPFAPPYIDQDIIDEVVDTLRSGWITTGPKTKLFENNLAEFCGGSNVLCLNSATAGLEIMLRWFGVKEGDEVILPAYTYSATANVIIHCGAKPVFVDVNDDFNISVEEIKKHITSNTKVIMPVDYGGFPCDYEAILQLAKTHSNQFQPNNDIQKQLGRIMVLSDAAHSFGASINGVKAGMLTDITVFSFHAVKNLTTAEGGAVLFNLPTPFNNQEIYNALRIKTLHGQNKDALAKTKPGNWRYDIVEAGYKMNMTDIQAAIGLVQLKKYDSFLLKRRIEIINEYDHLLKDCKWAILPTHKTETKISSYHLYALRIKGCSSDTRDLIMEEIFKRGVSVNVHFIPVPMMTFYKSLGYNIEDYPNTYKLYENLITLPVYSTLSNEELNTVIKTVVESVEKFI